MEANSRFHNRAIKIIHVYFVCVCVVCVVAVVKRGNVPVQGGEDSDDELPPLERQKDKDGESMLTRIFLALPCTTIQTKTFS